MRIGILTFQFSNNYGGLLQCYALQQNLLKKGHKVEVINYVPTPLTSKELWKRRIRIFFSNPRLNFCSIMPSIIKGKHRTDIVINNDGFDKFRKEKLSLSEKLTTQTIGEYCNKHYDCVVVGSDQVWTDLYDTSNVYFLGWEPEFKGIRKSYAACSAHNSLNDKKRREKLRQLLNKFEEITVRDVTTAGLVHSIIGIHPEIVPDPTELCSFNEFIHNNTKVEPYIFMYVLGSEIKGGHIDAIRRIREKVGIIPVHAVMISNRTQGVVEVADTITTGISPEDFINRIHNATVVYTDSFHATLISKKFNKPMVAYYNKGVRQSRLIDLKQRKGINNIVRRSEEIDTLIL